MSFAISLKYRVLISFSEFIGLILSLLPTIWVVLNGGVLEDTFTDIAFQTLRFALFLRPLHLLLVSLSLIILITTISILSYIFINNKENASLFASHRKWIWVRILIGLYVGYILGEILFYYLLNMIFYRNVFVTIPFFYGSALFLGVIGLFYGNMEFSPKIAYRKSAKTSEITISKFRLLESVGKILVFSFIALLLILPNVFPLYGFLPTPPKSPKEPYLAGNELFGSYVIKLDNQLPENLSLMVKHETASAKWTTYIYLPDVTSMENVNFPIAIYLHGYTGTDITLYHSSLETLAKRGVVGIFAQYATGIKLTSSDATVEFDHPSGNPELYVRYAMEWLGINQAVSALNLVSGSITTETLSTHLGNNYTLDYSRLMIIGHSMGGGMLPFILTKSLEKGWGTNELVLDMEAPWYASTWSGYEPNYTLVPPHTILNIATYEDDHSVSQCIGMNFLEKIREANGTTLSEDQVRFIYIHSDFHGFPRLLASHYLPIDPLDDPLHQFGYKKRIRAMAFYLFESAQLLSIQSNEAKNYFLGLETENMGFWSDGMEVNHAYTTNDPYGFRGGISLVQQIQDDGDELCTTG